MHWAENPVGRRRSSPLILDVIRPGQDARKGSGQSIRVGAAKYRIQRADSKDAVMINASGRHAISLGIQELLVLRCGRRTTLWNPAEGQKTMAHQRFTRHVDHLGKCDLGEFGRKMRLSYNDVRIAVQRLHVWGRMKKTEGHRREFWIHETVR